MAKKVFLSRERAIPSAKTPSASRDEIASTSRNNPFLEQLTFRILDDTSKYFPKFNATGSSLLIKFNLWLKSKIPVLT